MVIVLVVAILMTIKNKLQSKGQIPRFISTPGAQDLGSEDATDIENVINNNERKNLLGMDTPEEQALLGDPQSEVAP